MKIETEVFVVFDESDARKQHAMLLGSLGLMFQELQVGPKPLLSGLRAGHGSICLILPAGLNFLIAVSQIRNSFPEAMVVAVGNFSTTEHRINAYMAGADNCLSIQSGPQELAAILLGISRKSMGRIGRMPAASLDADDDMGSGRSRGSWILTGNGRTLALVDGPQLQLRKSEMSLLLGFASRAGMEICRWDTIEGSDGSRMTGRMFDVVVNRLRRKASAYGVTMPIRSIRGRGYVFAGSLSVEIEQPDAQDFSDARCSQA